jgi:hypothetical protein
MKTITSADRIACVADRWKNQYFGSQWYSSQRQEQWASLKALPENATAVQVAAITGNDSWTAIMCNECGQNVESAIVLNENEDYHTFTVCAGCLDLAQLLLRKETNHA